MYFFISWKQTILLQHHKEKCEKSSSVDNFISKKIHVLMNVTVFNKFTWKFNWYFHFIKFDEYVQRSDQPLLSLKLLCIVIESMSWRGIFY